MSEFLSSLPDAAEAVSGLTSLAFGAFGGVVLGDFVFSGFEVPDFVHVGGKQAMQVHKLPGGARVIDLLGDDPSDIAWTGVFLDGAPQARAQQLEQMRSAGDTLPLQFGTFFYTVIISEFSSDVLYGRVRYSITCVVLRNEATAALDGEPSLFDSVQSDISDALGISPSTLTSAISAVGAGVRAIGPLVPGSPGLAQATALISGASGGLSAVVNGSGALMGAITGASSLSSMTAAAGTLAQAVTAGAYLGRAVKNLA